MTWTGCGSTSPPSGGGTLSASCSRSWELQWRQRRQPTPPSVLPSPAGSAQSTGKSTRSETGCWSVTPDEGQCQSWHWDVCTGWITLTCCVGTIVDFSRQSSCIDPFGQRPLEMREHMLMMCPSCQSHPIAVLLLRLIHSCSRPLIFLLIISPGWSTNKRSSLCHPLEKFRSKILHHTQLHSCSADTFSATVAVSEALALVSRLVTASSAL